jgi:hypothetical protein
MFSLKLSLRGPMPRRKQVNRTTVKDLRSILRLTYEQNLSVRAISERLHISKTSVSTYLLRAREAGVTWPVCTKNLIRVDAVMESSKLTE